MIFKGKKFCFSKNLRSSRYLRAVVELNGGEVYTDLENIHSYYRSLYFICTPSEFDQLTDEVMTALKWDVKIYPKELITNSVEAGRFLTSGRFHPGKKIERRIIEEFDPPFAEDFAFPNLVNDIALLIFSFLPMNDVLKLRLVSKNFNALCLDNSLWKELCKRYYQSKTWIPNIEIEKVNFANHHWFLFYRKFLKPLHFDFKGLNTVARWSREGLEFAKNAANGLLAGAFLDTKRVVPGSLPIGTSKLCGDPDLPENVTIPKKYAFVCQLNLSELIPDLAFSIFHPKLVHTQFPKKGILYFFADTKLKSGLVYYYSGDVSKLKRRKLKGAKFYSFESAIKIYEHLTMNAEYCVRFTTEEMEEWRNIACGQFPYHSLFGYAHASCYNKRKNYLLQIRNDINVGIQFKDRYGDAPFLYYAFDENIKFDEGFINVEVGISEFNPFG